MPFALIFLDAGKGAHTKFDLPTVLHRIAHAPMLWHALRAGTALEPAKTVVVAGQGVAHVPKSARAYDESTDLVLQAEQLGTAHAVAQTHPTLEGCNGDAIVLYGDAHFISKDTLRAMGEARKSHDEVVPGFEAADLARYGRLVTEGDSLLRVVEFKDASEQGRAVTLCNSGLVAADAQTLFALIDSLENDNASGEYYVTDIVSIAGRTGLSDTVLGCDEAETMGVNSRADLSWAEASCQARRRAALREASVSRQAPRNHAAGLRHVGESRRAGRPLCPSAPRVGTGRRC
jgi:bifunctional UDP-N-acetylglucosamine pyrophosphorylase/glucosamine-1-phosphate N-acetyltransferase